MNEFEIIEDELDRFVNELKNVVTVFDLAEDSGTLTARQTISTLPVDFAGTSHCAVNDENFRCVGRLP